MSLFTRNSKISYICIATAVFAVSATPALASVQVEFDEGAPKDRFIISASNDCDLAGATVSIDIGTSPAGLIFDVTDQGAGVEVFQPLEFVSGQQALKSTPKVRDGQTRIDLPMAMTPSQSLIFTIDVDDTGGAREITVNNQEITGASVVVTKAGKRMVGAFDGSARAVVDCV